MKKLLSIVLLGLCLSTISLTAAGVEPVKTKFPSPDGYVVLLSDLHQHTVFSDGLVWPTTRVTEAKREGLDVIALTDHIEYTPWKEDVIPNYSRPYQIALPEAEKRNIILIPGLEITRGNPVKHLNALFLTNFNALVVPEFKDAVYAAADQGAFIFWNHPAWSQPGNNATWYPEMDEFLEKGVLKGFEVVNERDYQPDVIEWCLKHNVAMMGNSDIHDVVAYEYDPAKGRHRPMTLIFAKERTLESVKEALFAARTAAYHHTPEKELVIGKEEWLRPLFEAGFTYQPVRTPGKPITAAPVNVVLNNDFPFDLELKTLDSWWVKLPPTVRIPAKGTTTVEVTVSDDNFGATLEVSNLVVGKGQNLKFKIER